MLKRKIEDPPTVKVARPKTIQTTTRVNSAVVKTVKPVAKKPVVEKPVAKKAVVEKPVAKKPLVKKPVESKAATDKVEKKKRAAWDVKVIELI